ncbi:flagellar hook-length control protein FliK [Bradyrhizobium sp. S69]|uniref:flagellar hook-length control protein FliK n=1 Tax=Bradyrhizobium sp. S69 TaxID=1641856 RepID=UPI00131C6C73|nr:flagellar hook-length control protein FliK [Bradyrhizobium sp. S69]
MSITINPTVPLVAAQGVTSNIVLQPGTVINAQVQQLLGNDQVRIAIGGQSLDVASQVPLQAGQTLQLAVSQAPDGTINLAVVNQQAGVPASQPAASSVASNVTSDAVTLTSAIAATTTTTAAAAPQPQLTVLQALAVSAVAETAATQQTSLAPLFANLGVAANSGGLPASVQQAASAVLAQRTSLDQGLSGTDIKQAFQSSGLFLEASLAQGSASSGSPDLKAALIVLRQVLTSALTSASENTTAAATLVPSSGQPATTTPGAVPASATAATLVLEQGAGGAAQVLATPSIVITAEPETTSPSLVPTSGGTTPSALLQAEAPEISQAVLEFSAAGSIIAPAATPADAAARTAASSAALNLLQEAVQAGPLTSPLAAASASGLMFDNSQMLSLLPAVAGARLPNTDASGFARTNVPPPPINGALPAAQPVMAATLASHSPPETAMHVLLADTDGAIARQTLLQVASLPDQVDPSTGRIDPAAQRWNFEIPFLTPQGTAMAQFEISRDGGGTESEAAKRAWRARFTLDVEPAGPVHALVSLNGDKTSVRMWAERPATADQLRAGVTLLSQALSRAELQPGDIVIRDGAPSQPAAARAGHFLDRAL